MRIEQRELPYRLPDLGSLSPLLQRIYAARGISCAQELEYRLGALLPYSLLKGMDQAVTLLVKAIEEHRRILVVGDYDADGATGIAVAISGLRMLGAQRLDYLVPSRFAFGYGLSPELVAMTLDNRPDLLITVDNGISSVAGVAAAKAAGMQVLVTDHHLPGEALPIADAIVNPNQAGCDFPSKALAGVGVIFYVLTALRAALRPHREPGWNPNLGDLLDLVALGTVADIVPLDANNRILVQQGLLRMRKGRLRPGIRALLEVAGRSVDNLTAADLGFSLGPRLNVAGRLEDMSMGIECLLSEHADQAIVMAKRLDELNQERKALEESMRQEASALLQGLAPEHLPFGLCLYEPGWHQGVVGILASRLKERYHRPSIVFADAGDGLLKGSARSIEGFHIRDALERVFTRAPELLVRFGGHAMAAGLTLHQEHYERFSQLFDEEVRQLLDEKDLNGIFRCDALSSGELTLSMARLLRESGPWGQGFPEPLFRGRFQIDEQRLVGGRHLKLRVRDEEGSCVDAIAFQVDTACWPNPTVKCVELVYRMDVNHYRGNESLQLQVVHIAAADSPQ